MTTPSTGCGIIHNKSSPLPRDQARAVEKILCALVFDPRGNVQTIGSRVAYGLAVLVVEVVRVAQSTCGLPSVPPLLCLSSREERPWSEKIVCRLAVESPVAVLKGLVRLCGSWRHRHQRPKNGHATWQIAQWRLPQGPGVI